MLAEVGILIDERIPGRGLLRRSVRDRIGGDDHAVRDEVHLPGVPRDVDQVLVRRAIAVHIAGEHIAAAAGAAVVKVDANAGRPHPHEIPRVADRPEEPVARRELRIGNNRIVGIHGDGVTRPGARGDRAGIDGVLARPVAVSDFREQARAERTLDGGSDVGRVADPLIRQHRRVADVPVEAVGGPARPAVRAAEGGLRRRQVRVEVRHAVHVLGVQVFGRTGESPWQLLIDCDVRAPQLRELEVRIGERQLETRRRCARHGRRLVGVRIRVERIIEGGISLDEAGEHAGITDLVGDPHVRGASGENAGTAADLRGVPPADVVVEAEAGREQGIRSRQSAAVVMNGCAAGVAERHRIGNRVIVRRVLELGCIHP